MNMIERDLIIAAFSAFTMAALFATAWPLFVGKWARDRDRIAKAAYAPLWAASIGSAVLLFCWGYSDRDARMAECQQHRPNYECHAIIHGRGHVR